MMKFSGCLGLLAAALVALPFQVMPSRAQDSGGKLPAPVVVTPLTSTSTTADGQPIVLPRNDAEVQVSIFDIAPGATLPVHKHPFPRYAYVLAGTLVVTKTDTGANNTYKAGDFIVEMVGEWHQGSNAGPDPVKLLVIDQVEKGVANTVMRHQ